MADLIREDEAEVLRKTEVDQDVGDLSSLSPKEEVVTIKLPLSDSDDESDPDLQLKIKACELSPEGASLAVTEVDSRAALLEELEAIDAIASRYTDKEPEFAKELAAADPVGPIVTHWVGRSRTHEERRNQERDNRKRHTDSRDNSNSKSPYGQSHNRNNYNNYNRHHHHQSNRSSYSESSSGYGYQNHHYQHRR